MGGRPKIKSFVVALTEASARLAQAREEVAALTWALDADDHQRNAPENSDNVREPDGDGVVAVPSVPDVGPFGD